MNRNGTLKYTDSLILVEQGVGKEGAFEARERERETKAFEKTYEYTHKQTYEIDSDVWTKQYVWIVVFASFATFFAAFGIGANDVANGT